jgi:hypothetical protein
MTVPVSIAASLQAVRGVSKRTLAVAGGLAALLLVGAAWWVLGPVRKPDYEKDDLDSVMEFTLLTEEFNRLPVEERMKLMSMLVQRLKGMSGNDSLLLAAFASGIAGSARAQLETNASLLAIDVWDKYAKDYKDVPENERVAYLEDAYVNFEKMMEAATGNVSESSDQERLSRAKRQAQRDTKAMSDPDRAPDGEQLGRFFGFMNNNVGSKATPQQRARGALMMRDMVRVFRGQDPATGKPMPRPPG